MVGEQKPGRHHGPSDTVVQHLAQTYHSLVPAFERYMGLSRARWQVLVQLAREATISQATLQQRLGVDGAAITRQVKQLAEEGLVTREVDPVDNRFMLVTLTPAGEDLVGRLLEQRERFEALVTAGLSEAELDLLRHSLGRIQQNLAALPMQSRQAEERAPRPAAG